MDTAYGSFWVFFLMVYYFLMQGLREVFVDLVDTVIGIIIRWI